jgi:predicted PurR-regulated permease PerM
MSFKYLFPILSPFVIAYLLALLIERPVERFSKMLWGRKILASSIIMLALTTVLFGLVGYLLYMGACEVKAFVTHFDYYTIVVKQGAARICLDMDGWFGLTDGCCLEFISKYADKCAGALTGDEGSAVMERVMSISVPVILRCAAIMGIVIVTLMSVVYLSKVLEKVRTWRKTTVFHKEAAVITDALKGLMNVYFKIQFIIMAINATLCVIGLILIKNPYAVVIGILIGVLDALPIFGTGTVLIPWALVLLLLKHVTAAAVLMTVYVITYFVREIMESKCMGDRLGIAD